MRSSSRWTWGTAVAALLLVACVPEGDLGPMDGSFEAPLDINPRGETEIEPDLTRVPDELRRVFEHIDDNIDQHVRNLQEWIRQPSISNTGEGIAESAEMVRGFFEDLGCQEARVDDVPMTEWGHPGNPVVYARCDEGAEHTLLIYWMYDTMPVTQEDRWIAPPFEARILENPEVAPFPRVLIGRGAVNTKGPQMVQLNAFRSIREVAGRLPVNLIFLAEGDEERMSIGARQWVRDNSELLEDADALYRFGWQTSGGGASLSAGSEGSVFFNLTTSGASWGRGPAQWDIHGGQKRAVDSPAWRHIAMLNTLVSDYGNQVLVPGFYDDIEPLTEHDERALREQAEDMDLVEAAMNAGVGRYISDDPYEHLRMSRYGMAFNIDGIFGGNMSDGPTAGAVLPSEVTSKHNLRYLPNQDGMDLVRKIRDHLDQQGYEDVEMLVVGDVPWAKVDYDNPYTDALRTTYDLFRISYREPPADRTMLGPYWPAYLFSGDDEESGLEMAVVAGAAGHGGGSHAANEYWVIEGSGDVYGMAGAEKSVAAMLYAVAGLIEPAAPVADEEEDPR